MSTVLPSKSTFVPLHLLFCFALVGVFLFTSTLGCNNKKPSATEPAKVASSEDDASKRSETDKDSEAELIPTLQKSGVGGSQFTANSPKKETTPEGATDGSAGVSVGGGSKTGSISDTQPAKPSDPGAKKLLQDCIATYQSATSYSDEGVWRMDVPMASNPVNRTLDMRVAWEKPNKLAIRTANVTSAWTTDTFETVAGSGDVRPFDNQRVVRPRPEQITWSWLMDNHLAALLEVEMARSERPLALELLLNSQPLADWLSNGNFQVLSSDVFDQVDCKRIEVTVGQEQYVLWIDDVRKLVLRCDLPMVVLHRYFAPVWDEIDQTKVRFSIDMINAQINHNVDWSTWTMPRVAGEVLVRRFTEPPPRDVPAEIGKTVGHVVLKDVQGDEIFDPAEPSKPVMILQWIDTSDTSRTFVDHVRNLRQEIQKRGLGSFVDTLLVTNSSVEEMKAALSKWNCDLPVAFEVEKELGTQCGVQRMLTSVVLANGGQVQYIDPFYNPDMLLQIVEDLKQGRKVAERLRKTVVDHEAQYASRLHRNIIDRSQLANLLEIHREIAAFPLSFYDMTLEWRTNLLNGAVSGSGEFFPVLDSAVKGSAFDPASVFADDVQPVQVASLLDHQGNVIVVDQSGTQRIVAKVPLELATDADRIHVLTDPWSHRWLAVVPEGLPRFWYCHIPEDIFTTEQKPAESLSEMVQEPLEEGETTRFATWANNGEMPLLSIVTTNGRILSLDLTKGEISKLNPKVSDSATRMNNIVPRITENGGVIGWNSLWNDRELLPCEWLGRVKTDAPAKELPKGVAFDPEIGNWLWGRGKDVNGVVSSFLVGLEKSDTGETHAVLMNSAYEPLMKQTLSVLPRQCKLLATAETADQQFYWLATAPNLVLHLRSAGQAAPDQMSFGERVYGATILPEGNALRLIVVLENEVTCMRLVPKSFN